MYDPANFNDRLLPGLKGQMSEAELHVIKARLRGGILNKVRRGDSLCPANWPDLRRGGRRRAGTELPYPRNSSPLVRDILPSWVRLPDRQGIRHRWAVMRLRNQKQVVFQPLTYRPRCAHCTIPAMREPLTAGAYSRRTVDGKKQLRKREPNDWLACTPGCPSRLHQLGAFQANLKLLEANGVSYETGARLTAP